MVGLNFYAPSVRYIDPDIDPSVFDVFDENVQRVGVFVREDAETIFDLVAKFKLDYVQLHGDEDPSFCDKIAAQIPVIKVFRIDETFDFSKISDFESAEMYLFDTRTKKFGGSGKQFDWNILDQYSGDKKFLLSGGIGPEDVESIVSINHAQFVGIDINSKFESSPGIKNRDLLLPFLNKLNKSLQG